MSQLAAARVAIGLEALMSKTGANPVSQVLLHLGDFYEWRDYPDGGVWDRASGFGYFYHAHPGQAFEEEHGHFHLFWAEGPGARENLLALSMDGFGRLIGAFAPNAWHQALTQDMHVQSRYEQFRVELAFPCYAANLWLGAAVRALAPKLAQLHVAGLKSLHQPGVAEDRGRAVVVLARFDLQAAAVPPPKPSLKPVKR